jgi:hypothetical protein
MRGFFTRPSTSDLPVLPCLLTYLRRPHDGYLKMENRMPLKVCQILKREFVFGGGLTNLFLPLPSRRGRRSRRHNLDLGLLDQLFFVPLVIEILIQ